MQKKTGGHALQQQRRGGHFAEEFRQAHEKIGPHGPHRSIGARRGAGIGDAIARPDVRDVRPDALDDAAASMPGTPPGATRSKLPRRQ